MPTITLPDGRALEIEVTGPDDGPVSSSTTARRGRRPRCRRTPVEPRLVATGW